MQNDKRFLIYTEISLFFLFICLSGLIALYLGKDICWDLLDYHYYNGYAFLHSRLQVDLVPSMMQTFINPFFDVINYLIIAAFSPKNAAFILGAFTGVSCYFLYRIAALIFQDEPKPHRLFYIIFTLIIGMTGAANIALLGTTTNDTKIALLAIMSLYFLLLACARSRTQIPYLILSGLLSGAATGFKLPALCTSLGMVAAFAFSQPFSKKQFRLFCVLTASCLAGFLLATGYWMFFLTVHYQSPMFPFYNNIFHSPYLPSFKITDLRFYPQHYLTLPFYLAYPNIIVTDITMRDLRLAVIYSLTLILIARYCYKLIFKHRTSYQTIIATHSSSSARSTIAIYWRLLCVYFLVGYISWFFLSSIYRYFLPFEMLSGLIMIHLFHRLIKSRVLCLILLMIITIVFSVTTQVPNFGRSDFGRQYFSLSAPLQVPANATILFLSAPLAYLIPALPATLHFVGVAFFGEFDAINAKLAKPIADMTSVSLLHKKLANILSNHKQPMYGLFEEKNKFDTDRSAQILAKYHLAIDKQHCQQLESNVEQKLSLCPIISINTRSKLS